MEVASNAGAHNSIYRGQNLGTSVTSTQWLKITQGTFDDLFIGDYWEIDDNEWRIAAFDYWLGFGDTECTTHHVVIVPDRVIGSNQKMEDTNITTNGYKGSKMRTTNLNDAKTTINNAFGSSHILTYKDYLTSASSNGFPSARSWDNATVEIMSERMIYGNSVFATGNPDLRNNSSWNAAQIYQIDYSQFPLFKHDHSKIPALNAAGTENMNYWLNDIVSAAHFAFVANLGYASYSYASIPYGVRPCFGIVG